MGYEGQTLYIQGKCSTDWAPYSAHTGRCHQLEEITNTGDITSVMMAHIFFSQHTATPSFLTTLWAKTNSYAPILPVT